VGKRPKPTSNLSAWFDARKPRHFAGNFKPFSRSVDVTKQLNVVHRAQIARCVRRLATLADVSQ
jgi:hypothetical protein